MTDYLDDGEILRGHPDGHTAAAVLADDLGGEWHVVYDYTDVCFRLLTEDE